MKKKLLLILVIIALFIWVGIKGYQVAHSHAQNALLNVQTRLAQIVGAKGHYTYSDAHINWLTQSVIIKKTQLSLVDNTEITIRKIRATPKDVGSLSNLSMEGVEIKSPSFSGSIASLDFNNLTIPAFIKSNHRQKILWQDIWNMSFEHGDVKGAYFYTKWGKVRMGEWNTSQEGSAKTRLYLFYNVDIAPAISTGQSPSLDAMHFDKLIFDMSNDRKFNEKEFFSSFLTSTNYFLQAYGVIGFRNYQKRVSMGQLNIHLARQENTWEGEVLGDKVDYDLLSSFSLFSEYLKRLGYTQINGAFHSNFTYYSKDSLFALHKLNYFGYDFMGLDLQSRFYIDKKIFNPYMPRWSESILLKSMNLSVYDTGVKKHVFSILASNSGKSEDQVYNETLQKFMDFSKGKDFELDRQLYTALADILQNPKHMVQISMVFDKPERVNYLLNMNFLDFFKLINQNNMTITAVPKN